MGMGVSPTVKRAWKWLKDSVRVMPKEPAITQPKQVDPDGIAVGITIKF